MTRNNLRPGGAARCRRLVCLILCCSLGLQFLPSLRRPSAAAARMAGANPVAGSGRDTAVLNLPDLNGLRRRGAASPQVVPPVPPTPGICVAGDALCERVSVGAPHRRGEKSDLLAGLAGPSFLSRTAATLSGRPPVIGFSSSDFFPGSYAVSDAPANLRVTAAADSHVDLQWDPVAAATNYRVERSAGKTVLPQLLGTTASTSFSHGSLSGGHSYLYRVCVANSAGACVSAYSNTAMGTAYSFTDDPLVTFDDDPTGATVTKVRALHLTELRAAVASVRDLVPGLGNATWTNQTLTPNVSPIAADDIRDLRAQLGEALSDLSLDAPTYTDPTLYSTQDTGHAPTPVRRKHLAELRLAATRGKGAGPTFVPGYDFETTRLDPVNRTGGGGADPYSRNYNFQIPLVSLPGRAGLDLGLTLSYNSLVWTKDVTGAAVKFDADRGFPAPGFRLGFPTIQPAFLNAQTGKQTYLLLTPSGARVELRQTDQPGTYESANSSYLQLKDYGGTLELFATDGTRLSFFATGNEYLCQEVRDHNGNYLTATYNGAGLDTVTDTLGRKVSFHYEGGRLQKIEQTWKRATEGNANPADETHVWASFGFGEPHTLGANNALFTGLTVAGVQGGTQVPVLRRVGLADGSYYGFEYNQWGQIWKMTRYGADAVDGQGQPNYSHALTSARLDLPGAGASLGGAAAVAATAQADCPRFTEERLWIEDGVLGEDGEVTSSYSTWTPNMASCEVVGPGGKVKTIESYATTDWRRGMTTQSKILALKETTGVWEEKKRSDFKQEHDGAEEATYSTNPRVSETTVSDPQNNVRRTKVTYTTLSDFQGESGYTGTLNLRLPKKIEECAATCSTVLRTTVIDYKVPNLSQYVQRRILGLVRFQLAYEGAGSLRSKVGYVYDDTGHVGGDTSEPKFLQPLPSPAWQHYAGDYGTGLQWRGNATRVRRYEVDPENGHESDAFTEKLLGYNVAGGTVFMQDASGHRTSVSYTDAFDAEVNRTHTDPALKLKTYAYPTNLIDPEGFASWTWYNYDMGVATKVRTQQPNTTVNGTDGPLATTFFDRARRPVKTTNSVNQAHTEWVYDPSLMLVETFTTVSDDSLQNPALRHYSATALDGAGRVRGTARDFPGSTTVTPAGNYSAQTVHYDETGRVVFSSNPTEMRIADGTWTPAGDDANGGLWRGTTQEYDWKGRPTRTINPDETDSIVEYGGCGCAGGEVVTMRGELVPTNEPAPAPAQARRTQRVLYDSLGRPRQRELLNWNGSVYSSTTTKYDALDRPLRVRQYAGAVPASEPDGEGPSYQTTTMTYDGYGRLSSQRLPKYEPGTATTYRYNADDILKSVTDPRGVKVNYSYDKRHLTSDITHDTVTGVADTPDVSFIYDAVGNRMQMSDGTGQVTYSYNALSQLTSETREFTALPGQTYTTAYGYAPSGQLKYLIDPAGSRVDYGYDEAGMVLNVSGSGPASASSYASNMHYRAWGALKEIDLGNQTHQFADYDARLRPATMELRNVIANPTNQTPLTMKWNYGYYADGRLEHADDLQDNRFDRRFDYDTQGRLKEAYTGLEARGQAPASPANSPFRQSFQYDEWGNMKERSGRLWKQALPGESSEYGTDDRRNGWTYNAVGHLTQGDSHVSTYDAAGSQTSSHPPSVGACSGYDYEIEQTYDGVGKPARRRQTTRTSSGTTPQCVTTQKETFYVYSAALGGAKLLELDTDGKKVKGYIYAGGMLLAKQEIYPALNSSGVKWQHQNPGSASWVETTAARAFERQEMDPLGAEVGTHDPFLIEADPNYSDVHADTPMFVDGGDPFHLSDGCGTIDGMPASCTEIGGRLNGNTLGGESLAHGANGWKVNHYTINSDGFGVLRIFVEESGVNNDPNEVGDGDVVSIATHPGHWENLYFRQSSRTPSTPQNYIVVPVQDDLRGDVKKLLKTGDCEEYTNKLLKEVNKLFNPENREHIETIMDGFDKVMEQGGFQFGQGNNTVQGDLWSGNNKGAVPGTVMLSTWRTYNNPPSAKDRASAYGNYTFTAIHEIFHLAVRGHFSDEQVARAAYSLAGIAPPTDLTSNDYLSWSGKFDAFLMQHCPKSGAFTMGGGK